MDIPTTVQPIPLRRRKLMAPRPGSGLIARPRLVARLGLSLDVPLTLVIAPAGFGKTTLISQWLSGIAEPAAWLTVDGGDVDERRFVTHLVAAISSVTRLDSTPVLDLFRPPMLAPIADIGAALADALFDLPEELVIVLDDTHTATSAGVMSFMAHFLALMPPSVHLIILSRTDLPLPLARMKNQQQVNELRAAELRFTLEETETLVTALAPDSADAAAISLLQDQTEGWITGLRMTAQALALLPDSTMLPEQGSDRQSSMQFLLEEVLAQQSPADQDFLLRTSIAERFSADLASALLEESDSNQSRVALERLLETGLFVEPVGDEPGWARYHPLFRQLLRHHLARRLSRQAVIALHGQAARWFAEHAMIDEAITHLLATGDPRATAELVERSYHVVLSREDWPSLARWLRRLPEELIHTRPRLLLARGWVAHLSGRASPLRATLTEVEALVTQSDADPAEIAAIRGEAGALSLGTLLPIEQDPERARQAAEDTLRHVSPRHRFPIGLAQGYLGLIQQTLGQEREAIRSLESLAEREAEQIDACSIRALLGLIFAHRQAANYPECAKVCRHTLTLAERHDLAVTAGWAHTFLGWLAYERNDLERALTHFSSVVNDYRRLHLSSVRESMFGMALVYQTRGEPAAADAVVQRLTEIIVDVAALEHLAPVQGFEARLALLRHQTNAAARWLVTADVTINSNTLYAFEHALLTRAKVQLAIGTPDSLEAARHDLDLLRGRAASRHHRARLIEIEAITALVDLAQGRSDEAMAATLRAIRLVDGRPFARTFLDLGSGMTDLLRRAATQAPLPQPLGSLVQAQAPAAPSPRTAAARTPAVLQLLTLRECDVLERLGRRLSYQEIADELFISPGTVKRHVGSIYSKLDAGNRREALLRAEDLGWRPES